MPSRCADGTSEVFQSFLINSLVVTSSVTLDTLPWARFSDTAFNLDTLMTPSLDHTCGHVRVQSHVMRRFDSFVSAFTTVNILHNFSRP